MGLPVGMAGATNEAHRQQHGGGEG